MAFVTVRLLREGSFWNAQVHAEPSRRSLKILAFYNSTRFSRKAFVTTLILLNAIAPAARMGLS